MATGPSIPEQAVLYVDVLGFADLTMNSVEVPVRVPPYEIGDWQEDYGAGAVSFWTEKSPLSLGLLKFHRRLEDVLHKAARRGDLRAMLFSDGAFVVGLGVEGLALLAGEIMRVSLLNMIPVRMGLAYGTFQPLKFAAETYGDTGIYTSLFYGTGVVRAHYAERAGKGMRVFVHPSAIAKLPSGFDGIRSSSFELVKYNFMLLTSQSEHASHEFEYLHRRNATSWHSPGPDNSDIEDREMWDAVILMKSKASSDCRVQVHYTETLAALNRMRNLIGRASFEEPRDVGN